jgi:predicted membrane chloride channel (bestrophin family)
MSAPATEPTATAPSFVLKEDTGVGWFQAHTGDSSFNLRDSVIPNVLKRPLLWVSLVFSLVSALIRCQAEKDDEYEVTDPVSPFAAEVAIMSNTISMLNFAMVFFMGFYNSVCYSRWMANWKHTQIGFGRINDLNVLVPAYMKDQPKFGADVLRFVNAYHHFQYVSSIMGQPEDYSLQLCIQRHLLTTAEADNLRTATGSKSMRCLIWAAQSITASGIDTHYATQLNELVLLLRRQFAMIWSYDDQMLPFAYTHAVNFFVLIVVLAKSSISGFDYAGMMLGDDGNVQVEKLLMLMGTNFVYVFAILMLREVSQQIADPFSAYKDGIKAERYLDLCVAGTSALVADNVTHAVDPKQDPRFAAMAKADKDSWEFKPRPARDIKYMRMTRPRTLRRKKPPAAEGRI